MNSSFQIVCLGNGKSSFFFVSHTPQTTQSLVLTENQSPSTHVLSKNQDRFIHRPQTEDIDSVNKFILDGIEQSKPTAIVATTHPERGKNWLDKLLSNHDFKSMIDENPGLISFILPQSPNPFVEDFKKTGCPVVVFDYYPGIGGVKHGGNGIAEVVAGVKENTNYVVLNSEKLTTQQKENLNYTVRCLAGNKEIREFEHPSQISLPTNAFLHTIGIVVHITEELVKKGEVDGSILSAKTSKEFFDQLDSALVGKTPKDINLLLADSLVGKGFYRQMPQVGPNVLMMEMGDIVCQIRDESIKRGEMIASPIDEQAPDGRNMSHISNHLRGKYAEQFLRITGEDPNSISLGRFINFNPPYQNKAIVIPTNPDGSINTNHRFFTEELPTLKSILEQGSRLGISKKEMEIFNRVINFCERLNQTSEIESPSATRLQGPPIRSRL